VSNANNQLENVALTGKIDGKIERGRRFWLVNCSCMWRSMDRHWSFENVSAT